MSDTDFDAANVPELAYNFDTWLPDKRGRVVIPEPTTDQVGAFLRRWIEVLDHAVHSYTPTEAPKDETPEQRDERITRDLAAQEAIGVELADERRQILSDVCSGEPSVETLAALPHRVQRAFAGYLLGALNPES